MKGVEVGLASSNSEDDCDTECVGAETKNVEEEGEEKEGKKNRTTLEKTQFTGIFK